MIDFTTLIYALASYALSYYTCTTFHHVTSGADPSGPDEKVSSGQLFEDSEVIGWVTCIGGTKNFNGIIYEYI